MRNDGEIIISTKLDTKSFEKQIAEVEYELAQIDYELSHAKELKLDQRTINEYTKKAEQLNNKLVDLRKRQEDLNKNNFFGNIGNSIDGIIKRVTKWGLAIFGVRSAYMAVRRAASTISQYNDQIKTDLEYIQYSLAMALEPVVRTIISLAYQLLNIINSISMAFFNYNLFQNSSVDNFKKMNNSANQLKKTLAGFDEMNVLSSTSGGSEQMTLPSGSFDETEGKKFKSFWEDIIKFWEKDWEDAFNSITGNWNTFFQGLGYIGSGFYDTFKGLIELVKGVWNGLIALFKGDSNSLYNAWVTLVNGFKNIFTGLIKLIIGGLLTATGTIKGILLDLVQGINKTVIKPITNFFSNMWKNITSGASNAWDGVKKAFASTTSFFQKIVNKISSFFKNLGTTVGDVIGKAFKNVINGVIRSIENILNSPIRAINNLINAVNKIPGVNISKLSTFSLPRLAKGGIVNMPGRGVMVGGAIAGESGREAVLPLQDSAVLQEIADAIGRRITINANITNTMNGRVISRELQKVQNDSDFAFNR